MLRQRLDRLEWLVAAGPVPVGSQLSVVESCPFGHEPERAAGYEPAISSPSKSIDAA